MSEDSHRPASSSNPTFSRISRYPDAKAPLVQQIHAPSRGTLRYGKAKSNDNWANDGNFCARKDDGAKRSALKALRYITEGREFVDLGDEGEKEDSSVEEVEVIDCDDDDDGGEKLVEIDSVVPWMRAPIDVSDIENWALETLPCLNPRLKKALENMGISSLFPVQVAVWHETIGPGGFERDICVNSPTGSGKTLSYALPIVQILSSLSVRCLRALVVLPTRDLALQVKDVFDAIAPAVGLTVGLAVGQSSIAAEISQLIKTPKLEAGICYDPEDFSQNLESAVDILVATPGRLMDHINNTKGFTLEHLRYLVIDETDRLLREAYQSWLPTVLQLTQTSDDGLFPSSPAFSPFAFGLLQTVRRQSVERGFKGKPYPRLVKMVLSATLTQDPGKLIQLDLHHPLFITTGASRYRLPEKLECLKLICETGMKPVYLVALLKSWEGEKCIIFTSSVETTRRLCKLLNFFGDPKIKAKEYSGGLNQSVRSKELKALRKGDIQVLVASDALTRGMDVKGVTNVINYDMPPFAKTFIHRAGRTARAGQAGRCFTLLTNHEVKRFSKLLKKVGCHSCPIYPIPPTSLDSIRATYEPALEKLKELVESEAPKKGRPNLTNRHQRHSSFVHL